MGAVEWMNEWCIYIALFVYCCTPKALYNHVEGSLLNHHQCAASTWMNVVWNLPVSNGPWWLPDEAENGHTPPLSWCRRTACFSHTRRCGQLRRCDYTIRSTLWKKKQSLLLKRLQFRQRRQRAGESIAQYAADLRGLAKPCCFGALSDEMIQAQLIEKTNNTLVRERLLLEDHDLTLEKAIILASQIESAAQCAAKLNTAHESSVSSGGMIQECTQVHGAEADVSSSADIQYARPQVQLRCGNYGSTRHSSRAPDCPAQGQTCRRCQKLNHFAKWCRSAPVQAHAQQNPRSNTTTPAIIHSINTNSAGFSTCAVNIAESCIPLILDAGAKVSLLNMSTYDRFLPHLPLQPPSLNLFGYGSSAIDVIGLIHAPVQYDNKALPNFPFHITRHGSNILGLDLFMSLDFSLLDNKGAQILTVSGPWQQEWPMLFEGLGWGASLRSLK